MNEMLRFSFVQDGQPLNIDRLSLIDLDRGGVVLNGETSAWPRALRFGFEGVGAFKDRLNALRQQSANGTHLFNLSRQNGSLEFTTFKPDRIPVGTYEYRLRISDLDIEDSEDRVKFKSGESTVDVEVNVRPQSHRFDLTSTIGGDLLMADILNGNSRMDGKKIIDWLRDKSPRPKRKACLMNILAKLRTFPTPQVPLITFIEDIFLADVSRIYAKVAPGLFDMLQELDEDPLQPFTLDRIPIDPVHLRILHRIPDQDQDVTEKYKIKSFRQDAQPSLQIVVAVPPNDTPGRGFYADIDIDLGNPTRDVAGFFIHLGELMSEGKTDHIKMNKKLKKDPILSAHLHYSITKL